MDSLYQLLNKLDAAADRDNPLTAMKLIADAIQNHLYPALVEFDAIENRIYELNQEIEKLNRLLATPHE